MSEPITLAYVEDCLRWYPENCQALKDRRAWLEAVHSADRFEPHYGGAGLHGSHQERMVILFERDDILETLTRKTVPITEWSNVAPLKLYRVANVRYFERVDGGRRRTWHETALILHVSDIYARGKLRSKLLESVLLFFQLRSIQIG